MDKYVKVPVFPIAKYLTAKERNHMPAPMKPVSFRFGADEIHVDAVLDCDRGVSRKVGGRGFRFVCKVRWESNDAEHMKESVLWYDDFLQEWFVEVLKSRAPADWDMAADLSGVGDLEDG